MKDLPTSNLPKEVFDKAITNGLPRFYTSEDFKAMKKALKLTNKDIAAIIGTGEKNVTIQTAPGKELATWAKAFCFMFEKMTEQKFLNENPKN